MPPTRLPERPKPPSGEQMLADVASADDNDAVFVTGHALDLSDLTPTVLDEGGEGGDQQIVLEALAKAEKRESAQRAYHRVTELLDRQADLNLAPSQLESQFQHLSQLGEGLAAVIKDLQEQQLSCHHGDEAGSGRSEEGGSVRETVQNPKKESSKSSSKAKHQKKKK